MLPHAGTLVQEDRMAFTQSDSIEVKRIKGKGRGVFARRPIRKGELIEKVPMLVLPVEEYRDGLGWTSLADYCFDWGRGRWRWPWATARSTTTRTGPTPATTTWAADEGVHGPAGHRAGRGDHGQLQRRAEEPIGGLVRGRRGARPRAGRMGRSRGRADSALSRPARARPTTHRSRSSSGPTGTTPMPARRHARRFGGRRSSTMGTRGDEERPDRAPGERPHAPLRIAMRGRRNRSGLRPRPTGSTRMPPSDFGRPLKASPRRI